MNNTFNVGDAVKAISFTDCFGKYQTELLGLTVAEVTEHARMGLPPYYRVKAIDAKGYTRVEGAERYFALEAMPSEVTK